LEIADIGLLIEVLGFVDYDARTRVVGVAVLADELVRIGKDVLIIRRRVASLGFEPLEDVGSVSVVLETFDLFLEI